MKCPRCNTRNHADARFCGRCGLPLVEGAIAPPPALVPAGQVDGIDVAGADSVESAEGIRWPAPLDAPDGFTQCANYRDLHFRWEAAWGGAMLLGSETLAVVLFNAGYPLEQVVVKIVGEDHNGEEVFVKEHEVDSIPRGKEVTIEVPSYELSSPASDIKVALLSGRYAEKA